MVGAGATFSGVAVGVVGGVSGGGGVVVAGGLTVGVSGAFVGVVTARAGEAVAVACSREDPGRDGEFSQVLNWIAPKIASPPSINARARIPLTGSNQLRFDSVGRGTGALEGDEVAGVRAGQADPADRRAFEATWVFNASRKSQQFADPGFESSGNSACRKIALPEAVNSGIGTY